MLKKEAKLPDEGFSDPDEMRIYKEENITSIDELLKIDGKVVKSIRTNNFYGS